MRPDRLDDNRSAWLAELPDSAPYERSPALRGDATADIAIIGGGITGVSTAWHLSERFPDRRIVLLEAKCLANGASGRNGGQVLNGINGVEPHDPGLAGRVHAATSAGIDIVAELAGQSALDCGFERRGCLEVYTTPRSAEEAQARTETWRAWGLPVQWLPRDRVALSGAYGAVLDPTAGRINCAALLRGLRPRLQGRGVAVHEDTPVMRIDDGATLRLTTREGQVRAGAVVLATAAYTPLLGFFRHGILPLHSHMIATGPLAPERWAALGGEYDGFADDLDRIAYGCRSPGGRMLFGGGSNAAYTYRFGGSPVFTGDAGRNYAALERRLHGYFPALTNTPIEHRWSGSLAITFDRVCTMGVTGPHRNIFYALGYSGHGLALGALAGRVLRDLYSDDHAPWRDLPFYHKRLLPIPPEPIRWLGYQMYTRMTGRSPRRR